MGVGTVFPKSGDLSDFASVAKSLFGRPVGSSYKRAVAKCLNDIKAKSGLNNVELAEVLACDEKTIRKALTAENGNLDVITLLNVAYVFGEDVIEPVRALYLCAGREPETPREKVNRLTRELQSAVEAL
jgi:hypothetical protein